MTDHWTSWKFFPDDFYGDVLQAPTGPGLYEVCRSSTREQVAFGCARNVTDALNELLRPRGIRKWLSFRRGGHYESGELEYRIWSTGTLAEAKGVHALIRQRHAAAMRQYGNVARV